MQKNILCRLKSQNCCGCGACANKCPVSAISMQENEEGFLAPAIDENLCTDCGLCAKACPALNVRYENTTEPECYAAMAEDKIRMKSSSGRAYYRQRRVCLRRRFRQRLERPPHHYRQQTGPGQTARFQICPKRHRKLLPGNEKASRCRERGFIQRLSLPDCRLIFFSGKKI